MFWKKRSAHYHRCTRSQCRALANVLTTPAWLFPPAQIAAFELQLLHRATPDSAMPGGEAVEGGVAILRAELAAKEALLQRAQVLRPLCFLESSVPSCTAGGSWLGRGQRRH